jgi:site-specific recombinase XerD
VKAAGIEREPGKRLTPHVLRHSFGSNLLNMGEELVDVSRWLGHKQLSTTQRIYFHEVQSLSKAAADRMRERMERRRVNNPVNTEGGPGAPAESLMVPESPS